MKYYFTGSTKNLKEDISKYGIIFKQLEELGCIPLNYVHLPKNDPQKNEYEKMLQNDEVSAYKLQTSLIDQADILIADVTRESITVGYQIDYAIRKKVPVLVLADKNRQHLLPVMLTHDHFGLLTVEEYETEADIKDILTNSVKLAISDRIKFNFFINIPIHTYISKRAASEEKNKSEVIRKILLEEMKRNPV